MPHVIPSKDTINRVFSSLDSAKFETCFIEWVNSITDLSKGQIIAIDGKTIRGAKLHGKKSPIHMVSAWACESNLVLGQIKTAEKSNEITAIPQLLDILDIAEQTVTIDVMETQKEIAEKIIKNEANYILAVKANKAQLLEHVEGEFKFAKQLEISVNEDLGHGRIETRTCRVITDFKFIENQNDWKNLASIIRV